MSRYIDADGIQYTMLYKENWITNTGLEKQGVWKDDIDKIPTADVRKNVKGQWLDYWDNPIKSYFDGRYSAHCSVCGYHPEYEEEMRSANFCPNCGAEMRGRQHV